MGKLAGKVAIVTGAAGGIGRGIVAELLGEGAKVVATDLRQDALDAAVAEWGADASRVATVAADIARRDDVRRVVQAAIERFGRLDGLVNNASASRNKPLLECTDDDLALALNTSIWATFYFMQEAYPHLKLQGGSIVNFGSGAAISGQPKNGTYAAGKEGVRGMTRTAVHEWGPDRIRINVVLPYATSPAMIQWSKDFPDLYARSLERVALGYAGDPRQDIAPVVAWLLSEESRYVTGQTIAVDGGQVVRP
ncbi:MAG: SDR family oxidoreductase [Steroidobacteraceae bacterium]|jgi:NAD(P)-dependent dehydrogenase (short-subunit alcohol dehydrogenase family)|nr:SDR family oxidoreductase [Steroidobacteraceae bacterium]